MVQFSRLATVPIESLVNHGYAPSREISGDSDWNPNGTDFGGDALPPPRNTNPPVEPVSTSMPQNDFVDLSTGRAALMGMGVTISSATLRKIVHLIKVDIANDLRLTADKLLESTDDPSFEEAEPPPPPVPPPIEEKPPMLFTDDESDIMPEVPRKEEKRKRGRPRKN